jgi:endoribonuclease Dicer
MKCIVFVNRIVTARSLSHILQNLKFLTSWKCDFLVGVHSGLKSMSRKTMNVILERFRTGKVLLYCL